ncbi:coiled-coil domain-containing protein 6-like [Aphidius gifuensis]|uniref:coiled-coil domain-containing protein 6-like n=1 Tax=Aphidius gifuensis TaxID=684658 RepID=UPI001CDC5566|nr:coiled-coil domain-containing protein 6-like [Aphidius gifuensis]
MKKNKNVAVGDANANDASGDSAGGGGGGGGALVVSAVPAPLAPAVVGESDNNKIKITKHQQKKENKVIKQQKLAEEYKKKFTPEELLQRSENRKQEQLKKKMYKKLRAEKYAEKSKEFLKKQLEDREAREQKKLFYQENPNYQQQQLQDNTNNNKIWTIVFIGQTKIMKKMKGYRKPPLRQLEKKLLMLENVIVIRVDEYYTTQNCSLCFQQAIVSQAGHRYTFCPHCKITWHRDINAARNIAKIGLAYSGINPNKTPKDFPTFDRKWRKKN